MTHVRFASRFVRETLVGVVDAFLRAYNWCGPVVPFGAKPVTLVRRTPKPTDLVPIDGNMVFVSFGPESDHVNTELGSGLLRIEHIFFIDVVGESETIAYAIASDIKDRMTGLFGGTRWVCPVDPQTGLGLPGYIGELTDVIQESPNGDNHNWISIKATYLLDFPGEES